MVHCGSGILQSTDWETLLLHVQSEHGFSVFITSAFACTSFPPVPVYAYTTRTTHEENGPPSPSPLSCGLGPSPPPAP